MFKFYGFLASAVVCVACGASFTANEGNGTAAGAGNAGEASGGLTSFAGGSSVGDAGEQAVGGSSAAGSGGSIVGAGGTTTGEAGWYSGRGGWGNGGWRAGAAGGSTVSECATLAQNYEAAVEKARLCDKGSTDQCTTSSVAQPVGCGCPVLINAKSEAGTAAKKAYQAYQDAKCQSSGATCDIFCAPPVSASCTPQAVCGGLTAQN